MKRPEHQWPVLVAIPALCLSMVGLHKFHKVYPQNYYFLALFTLAQGYLVGTAALLIRQELVIASVAISCLITVGLILYATVTMTDFTTFRGCLFSLRWALLCFSGFLLLFPQ